MLLVEVGMIFKILSRRQNHFCAYFLRKKKCYYEKLTVSQFGSDPIGWDWVNRKTWDGRASKAGELGRESLTTSLNISLNLTVKLKYSYRNLLGCFLFWFFANHPFVVHFTSHFLWFLGLSGTKFWGRTTRIVGRSYRGSVRSSQILAHFQLKILMKIYI